MLFKGKLRDVSRDWKSNTPILTFSLNDGNLEEIQAYQDAELSIEVKKYRNKRSLNANAYAWVLMQKLAESVHSTKEDIYTLMLHKYSSAFTHVICKENAIERIKEMYRVVVDLGEITIGNTTGHQLQIYFGSSTFDSQEMSRFIDGLVMECKELGIETLPPAELERIMNEWGNQS